jgi:uncharacterized protein YdgA (DUF945 family)
MASAVLAVPSHAQDAAPAAPKAPPKPPQIFAPQTTATLRAAQKELEAAVGKEVNTARQMALFASFQFSPELQPKLKEIFGAERPFPVERVAGGAKGRINYVGKLAPYTYVQGNGTDFTWSELTARMSADKAGRTLDTDVSWPSLVIARPGGSVSLQDMTFNNKRQRGADAVDYGTARFNAGSIVVRDSADGSGAVKEVMRFEGVEAKSDVRRRGAVADIIYGSTTKAIVIGNERIERANFAFRLTNVPGKALAELTTQLRAQQGVNMEDEAERKRVMKTLTDFGKRAVTAGATLFIDDISAAYRGNVASLKGRLGFQKVEEADFASINALMKKIVAHFELRVPVALVRDVGRMFAAKAVDPSAPDADKQIEAGADGMVSMVIGKTVTGGYGTLVKDELRTVIDIKGSKITVNGKAIELPAGMVQGLKAKTAPANAETAQ